MNDRVMDGLQVLVAGIGNDISRDVVRLLADQGAEVTAISDDPHQLARFERDLRLFRTQVQAVHLNLTQPAAIKVFEANLRFFDRLPHVMVCCGGQTSGETPLRNARGEITVRAPGGNDGAIAARILQPSLVLHAHSRRRSRLRQAFSSLRHRNLFQVLARDAERGLLDGDAAPVVRLGQHLFTIERPAAQADASRPTGTRARLIAARRAEAIAA